MKESVGIIIKHLSIAFCTSGDNAESRRFELQHHPELITLRVTVSSFEKHMYHSECAFTKNRFSCEGD